jgi:hypothetical protein
LKACTPLEKPISIADNHHQTMATEPEVNRRDMKKLTAHDTVQDLDKDLNHPQGNPSDDDFIYSNFQPGVQDIEAVTISWSMGSLVIPMS